MTQVSVVIPCYNAERFIGGAVQSILDQTHRDLEVIVVDDGSTDRSSERVASFSDPRIRYIHQENSGPSRARNTGISAASNPYVAFLDADDLALPHRISSQLEVMKSDPSLSVVASGYEWIDEQGQRLHWGHSWRRALDLNDLRNWIFDCPVVPSATMIRRSAWKEVGGFEEDLRGGEDWNFWMRLVLAGQRMTWHLETVCLYRYLPGSLSQDAPRMSLDSVKALRRIVERPDFPPELLPLAEKGLALRYIDGAKRLYRSQLWEQGRSCIEQAISLHPDSIDGQPSRIELELISGSLEPLVKDPIVFLTNTLDHLPDNAAALRTRKHLVLARAYTEMIIRRLFRGDRRLTSQHWARALSSQLCWFTDRSMFIAALGAIRNRFESLIGRISRNDDNAIP